MGALSLLSIALLLAALAGCVALWTRSGETRVGLFGALFLLVAIHQAVSPWTNWSDPVGWNFGTFGRLADVAVGALGILAVVALWRTLAERDRAEKLHWDSMEVVRVINELNADDSISLAAKLEKLLEMGASRFDLEIAMVAQVQASRYEVIAIRAPESFPVTSGAIFSLDETLCKNTLNSERPVGIERVSESNEVETLGRAVFPFDAYLGATIPVEGAIYGTLSFASFEPRKDRFNGTDKDLIRLIAQSIGSEIGKQREPETPVVSPADDPTLAARLPLSPGAQQWAARSAAAKPQGAAPRDEKRSDARLVERVIDPNRILQRMGNELRTLAGGSVDLTLKLDPDLGFAAAQNLPLKAITRTLVMNARDAMPEGGKLVVETANLDIAAGEPGQMPALAPDRYVTVSFIDSGTEPDADALSRLFDRGPADEAQTSSDERLALSTIYRILQICGGDLSVKVEPGRGSTFTVYLPRARERVRPASKPAPARALAIPGSTAI